MLEVKNMIKSYNDLEVYKMSYELAMDIFKLTRNFPKDETYSLTSQVVRSSRSISANISEGWAKREYENIFRNHIISALGSSAETENWLLFAKDCNYITQEEYTNLIDKNNIIGKMLTKLNQNWRTYDK